MLAVEHVIAVEEERTHLDRILQAVVVFDVGCQFYPIDIKIGHITVIGADAQVDAETAAHGSEGQCRTVGLSELLGIAETIAAITQPQTCRSGETVLALRPKARVAFFRVHPRGLHLQRRLVQGAPGFYGPCGLRLFDIITVDGGHSRRVDQGLHPIEWLKQYRLALGRFGGIGKNIP